MPAALRLEAQTPQQSVIDLPNDVDRVLRDYVSAWAARDAEALANLFTPYGFVL
jgi:ketosteroid isomerase-like protein